MPGAFAVGPLADRRGRKTMLVASMIVFGAASVASSLAGGLTSLIAWRFATGLGLIGGAMPMTITWHFFTAMTDGDQDRVIEEILGSGGPRRWSTLVGIPAVIAGLALATLAWCGDVDRSACLRAVGAASSRKSSNCVKRGEGMSVLRRVVRLAGLLLIAALLFGGGWLAGRSGIGSVVDPASLNEAERQFSARMQNVTMVGTFTVAGRENRAPSPDRYDIVSVQKVGDDLWRFNARMNCCGMAGTGAIPIVVPMRFVGDTPVIMMTDTSLPGLGTFTVRVFFYGDRYTGTWQHGRVGGYMSGRIEKSSETHP